MVWLTVMGGGQIGSHVFKMHTKSSNHRVLEDKIVDYENNSSKEVKNNNEGSK